MSEIKIEINPCMKHDSLFRTFIESLPLDFNRGGEILYDKRNVIKKFRVKTSKGNEMDVVVKRYRKPNFIQKFAYGMFRKGKAERAFHNALELHQRNVSTPVGYAYMEIKEQGMLLDSFFVSGVDDAPPIRKRLILPEQFDCTMAEDLAQFICSLHEKGILHHDFNSTNVLYHNKDDGHYWFSLIDINRMDIYPEGLIPDIEDCLKNMSRFTERDDVLRYVASRYAELRNLDKEVIVKQMLRIKDNFVRRRTRRKKILRVFKKRRK